MSGDATAERTGFPDDARARIKAPPVDPSAWKVADRPTSQRARRRRRHLASLFMTVAIPATAAGAYLYFVASDQYVSEFRFSVRRQAPLRMDPGGLSSMLGGGNPLLAMIADSEVVAQYLRSRQVIDDIAGDLDMNAIYARPDADWLARLEPGASAERRLRYWRDVVDPFFDLTTGVISVKVRAFSPADAGRVAATVLAAAERRVNEMSARAHRDKAAYAEQQAAEAEARLRRAGAAMAEFRNANQVLFPRLQATTNATVEGQLRAQIAEARTTMATLRSQGVPDVAGQMRTLQARVAATEAELSRIQSTMVRQGGPTPAAQDSGAIPLASVIGGYGEMEIEESIAGRVYERALGALQDARNEASQQQVYLDAFVRPAEPQESLYPVRWRVLLETVLGSFVAWCLGMLMLHGIRDHLD